MVPLYVCGLFVFLIKPNDSFKEWIGRNQNHFPNKGFVSIMGLRYFSLCLKPIQ